eukprot:TRINITY_DN34121_c0_g1_i1.p1 TRINITY_DN34121_c0_g1~~TRINITY_DN34121_c0_g1_i1.p1  ORF type:complete len:265 (-),score=46.52 TRINITY_DN34121_c0_g1_i1:56-850(-)
MSVADSPNELRSLASSRYQEDIWPPGHESVWGSWYCAEAGSWGFACCRATSRQAAPCKPEALLACPSESEDAGVKKAEINSEEATMSEWQPRASFETAVGFLAHSMQHLVHLWQHSLRDGSLAAGLAVQRNAGSTSSSLLSEKAAAEAARTVHDFCKKLGAHRLPAELVGKLEEMCTSISTMEYAHANKIYMDLVIGAKKWQNDMPYMVNFSMSRQDTEVHWTPDSGSHPVDDAGVRSHVVVLRRLMTVAQALRPNPATSKNCG